MSLWVWCDSPGCQEVTNKVEEDDVGGIRFTDDNWRRNNGHWCPDHYTLEAEWAYGPPRSLSMWYANLQAAWDKVFFPGDTANITVKCKII